METLRIITKMLKFIDDGNLREARIMFELLWKLKELDEEKNKVELEVV